MLDNCLAAQKKELNKTNRSLIISASSASAAGVGELDLPQVAREDQDSEDLEAAGAERRKAERTMWKYISDCAGVLLENDGAFRRGESAPYHGQSTVGKTRTWK